MVNFQEPSCADAHTVTLVEDVVHHIICANDGSVSVDHHGCRLHQRQSIRDPALDFQALAKLGGDRRAQPHGRLDSFKSFECVLPNWSCASGPEP